VIDVQTYSDDVPVPWFGPRMRCDRCGHLGADAPPSWGEGSKRDKREVDLAKGAAAFLVPISIITGVIL
jgi:hypothetical protein